MAVRECSHCGGSGKINADMGDHNCPYCQGAGKWECTPDDDYECKPVFDDRPIEPYPRFCSVCGGSGDERYVNDNGESSVRSCTACGGTGYRG